MSGTDAPAARAFERGLVVVIAPDSFKGSLTSVEVARALPGGGPRARPAAAGRRAPRA